MSTFNLSAPIYLVDPYANVDSRYGPWSSINDANDNINPNVRRIGLTVGVSAVGVGVTEYWYKNGIQNTDLILKSTGTGGNSADLTLVGNLSSQWTSSTSTVCALSSNWNSVYSLVNTNSSFWTYSNVVTSFSLSSGGSYIIDASKGNVFFRSVVQGEVYSYVNFTTGKTIIFYLSGGENIWGSNDDILHQFPTNTYFNNIGESNYVLTITGKITKITLTNVNNTFFGSTELFDLNQPQQYVSTTLFGLLLDNMFGYILTEDNDRLMQDDTPVLPPP